MSNTVKAKAVLFQTSEKDVEFFDLEEHFEIEYYDIRDLVNFLDLMFPRKQVWGAEMWTGDFTLYLAYPERTTFSPEEYFAKRMVSIKNHLDIGVYPWTLVRRGE